MAASVFENDVYTAFWGDALQGYVCAEDIGAVAAAVLREEP